MKKQQVRGTDSCSNSIDGFCAAHKDVIERRGQMEKKLAYFSGAALAIGIIISASFVNSENGDTEIKQNAKEYEKKYDQKHDELSNKISTLVTTVEVTNARQEERNKIQEETNKQLKSLVDEMKKDNAAKRKDVKSGG